MSGAQHDRPHTEHLRGSSPRGFSPDRPLPPVGAHLSGARMSAETPEQRRAFLIHYARVMLTEAKARRHKHKSFARHLIASAAKARREAADLDTTPAQKDLFA